MNRTRSVFSFYCGSIKVCAAINLRDIRSQITQQVLYPMTHHQNPEAAKQIKWTKNRASKAMSLLEMIDKLEQYSTYKPCELGMPDDATWPSIYTTWNSTCKIPFLPTMDQDFYPVIKAGRHQVGRDILCITGYHIYSILRNESKLHSALNRLCPTKSSAVESNRKGAQKLIADCLFLFAEGVRPLLT